LLDTIAGSTDSITKEELCQSILAKVEAYKTVVGSVIAWRRTVTLWIETCTQREALLGFVPKYPEVPDAS
jgi:hypothetical protein